MYVPEQQEQGYKTSELSLALEGTMKLSYTYPLSSLPPHLTNHSFVLQPYLSAHSFLELVSSSQLGRLAPFPTTYKTLAQCISSSDLCSISKVSTCPHWIFLNYKIISLEEYIAYITYITIISLLFFSHQPLRLSLSAHC